VALTGKQRAALLLTSLDAATAAELLKGIDSTTVQELAVEISYLEANGHRTGRETTDVVRQFCKSLQEESAFGFRSFLKEMLRSAVGEDQARRIQQEIQTLLQKRDPFLSIRSADLQILTSVLETEHPQAVAVILSELPPKRGTEVLGQLSEGVRISAISRMTGVGGIPSEAKMRIAQMVRARIEAAQAAQQAGTAMQTRPEQSLRKVAVLVRSLDRQLRDGVLQAIGQKDEQTSQKVEDLMILWEDLPLVDDRTLQEVLRCMTEKDLAVALHDTSEEVETRIRNNISERMAAAITEETSLISSFKKEEVREAREKIVAVLRERLKMDKLTFVAE
jgi:flagellar motor switch protein FliG